MEMRSSSEDNQFSMFNRRFRFPLKRRKEFEAQREFPTTTKRLCLPVSNVPATANVNGPFLSLAGSTLISAECRSNVAKLFFEVANNFATLALAPSLISSDRATGKPVA